MAKEMKLDAQTRSKENSDKALLKDPINSKCPASFLRKHKNFTLIVDKVALGKI